jgi:hypothetical protein
MLETNVAALEIETMLKLFQNSLFLCQKSLYLGLNSLVEPSGIASPGPYAFCFWDAKCWNPTMLILL